MITLFDISNELENRIFDELNGKNFSKKELVAELTKILGFEMKCNDFHMEKDEDMEYFVMDKELPHSHDINLEISFERCDEKGRYQIVGCMVTLVPFGDDDETVDAINWWNI